MISSVNHFLLDCNALGQVSWLVLRRSSSHGHVVGEELYRGHFEDGRQQFWGGWGGDAVLNKALRVFLFLLLSAYTVLDWAATPKTV